MCALKLPNQDLDVDQYLQNITTALSDSNCAIFIDTNILSQLYKLNDSARSDFFDWINNCDKRFHVPAWVIHEYSHRVYSNRTSDYLTELNEIGTINKNFISISNFLKGYIGDDFLIGSQYQNNKADFQADVDKISTTLAKVSKAINNNKVEEHKRKVHKEIRDNMESKVLNSDIYQILQESDRDSCARYANRVPPGFMDSHKEDNSIGDIIIWKEILKFCKDNKITKALLISRDAKKDIVYYPSSQTIKGRRASENEKISIAKESLIFEFFQATGSEDFFVVDFYTLVKQLATRYQSLAISFQIATENENQTTPSQVLNNPVPDEGENGPMQKQADTYPIGGQSAPPPTELKTTHTSEYSEYALADKQYYSHINESQIGCFIKGLMSHNWYTQNDAIKGITSNIINGLEDNQGTKDALFVLGRNILQSADGSSVKALDFIEHLSEKINSWNRTYQEFLIDGMLFEIYFDSEGKVREQTFKASLFDKLYNQLKTQITFYNFDFINSKLNNVTERFVPSVGTDKIYSFNFEYNTGTDFPQKILCNDIDITSLFISVFQYSFSHKSNIKESLSRFLGIPTSCINVQGIPDKINEILYINPPSVLVSNSDDIFL